MTEEDDKIECGDPLESRDGYCDREASYPDGKCKYHSQMAEQGSDDWSPNYEHGLYMDRSGYYKSLPGDQQKWIDAVVDSFLRQAPFTANQLGKLEKLRHVAIDMHKKRRADEYIHKRGMAQTQETGFHEQYGVITEEKENVLHITADRLSRSSLKHLKDLGILDEEEDDGPDGSTLVENLSKALEDDDE